MHVVRANNALNFFAKNTLKNISLLILHILSSNISLLHFLHIYFMLKYIHLRKFGLSNSLILKLRFDKNIII